MKTLRLTPDEVPRAAALLRAGGTVAFATETVYGLGANALDAAAVKKIFAAKQRPHWDPLIVHVADDAMLRQVAREVPVTAERLMARFWPGPLTLLLPRTAAVPDAVTAGRPLVGVRMPAHPLALSLIRAAGVPVAAPSANRFGHTSPTTAAHVLEDLDGRIDAVLDGGPCRVGVESTVVEVVADGLVVYRAGGVSVRDLEQIAGEGAVRMYEPVASTMPVESLPSPGVGIRHYAPKARLVLVDPAEVLEATLSRQKAAGGRLGVMLPAGWMQPQGAIVYAWGEWRDAETLARRLYDGLRTLDAAGADVIVCPLPPSSGLGDALRDRLRKAVRAE